MKVGVNDNNIEWYKIGENNYLCFYYIGDGVKRSKLYENVTQSFIDKLTIDDVMKR